MIDCISEDLLFSESVSESVTVISTKTHFKILFSSSINPMLVAFLHPILQDLRLWRQSAVMTGAASTVCLVRDNILFVRLFVFLFPYSYHDLNINIKQAIISS